MGAALAARRLEYRIEQLAAPGELKNWGGPATALSYGGNQRGRRAKLIGFVPGRSEGKQIEGAIRWPFLLLIALDVLRGK
jgi:hypothetical protein